MDTQPSMPPSTPPQPVSPSVFVRAHALLSVPVAVLIAAVMVSGSILYVGNGNTTAVIGQNIQDQGAGDVVPTIADPSKLVTDNDPILGNPKAKVTIVEFSDFQCPFCRAFFEDTYSQIKKEYVDTGKARIVYRDFPLSFHPASKPAALAAQCANDQSKFWEFHDKIFTEQAKQGQGTVEFGVPELKAWASQIGLNASQFNECLDSAKHDGDVEADIKAGTDAGVSGTPSFFVNGQLLVGAQPFATFKTAIDQELAK